LAVALTIDHFEEFKREICHDPHVFSLSACINTINNPALTAATALKVPSIAPKATIDLFSY